ncbi:MAG: hypothetical protein V4850_24270 [Myxococcota bacterium]
MGCYLVWRRGPLALRILASTLGAVAAGLVAARLLQPLSLRLTLAGLAVLAIATTAALWRAWRHARTTVRAVVGPAGLSLEPVRGGPPYTWRWGEVRLVRTRDDDDGTLTLTATRTGTLLLSHDGTTPLDVLVQAIRAHGGHVEEDLS